LGRCGTPQPGPNVGPLAPLNRAPQIAPQLKPNPGYLSAPTGAPCWGGVHPSAGRPNQPLNQRSDVGSDGLSIWLRVGAAPAPGNYPRLPAWFTLRRLASPHQLAKVAAAGLTLIARSAHRRRSSSTSSGSSSAPGCNAASLPYLVLATVLGMSGGGCLGCRCGNRGCWQTPSTVRMAASVHGPYPPTSLTFPSRLQNRGVRGRGLRVRAGTRARRGHTSGVFPSLREV